MPATRTFQSLLPPPDPLYPESDGKPIADNTEQLEWIMTILGNLQGAYRDEPNVLVVGDLLWYPVEGRPRISTAPDVYVVFGVPKGPRRSYIQHKEGGVAPQVTFEIMSHNNTPADMQEKLEFYDRHGVEEYYLYDPATNDLSVWIRENGGLQKQTLAQAWVSPRLRIRFEMTSPKMVIYHADNRRFATFEELMQLQESDARAKEQALREAARERRAKERERRAREKAEQAAEREHLEKERERQEKERERQRAELLAAKLRALGIDPDA